MEGCFFKHNPKEFEVNMRNKMQDTGYRIQDTKFRIRKTDTETILRSEKGIALVMALIISLGIMVLVTGVLYFSIQSTSISGAGKRYSTCEEAADGTVEVIKEGINMVMVTEPIPSQINDSSNCFVDAAIGAVSNCTVSVNLPGTVGTDYTSTVTFQNLLGGGMAMAGGRIEFPPTAAGGTGTTAVYFRVVIAVQDSTGTVKLI